MKKLLLGLSCLLVPAATAAADEQQNLIARTTASAARIIRVSSGKRTLNTFLGNPKYKYRRIRRVLKQAQQKILLQRGYLNDYISEIIRNENNIASSDNRSEIRRLIRSNIILMHKIERVRMRIAHIQLNAQQKVLRIERNSFLRITGSANRQQGRIRRNPAGYWIWRRKHLLNMSELKDSLPESLIRKYYR